MHKLLLHQNLYAHIILLLPPKIEEDVEERIRLFRWKICMLSHSENHFNLIESDINYARFI
jgi:hypothetical protein